MQKLARRIAECYFTDHTLRTAGMSTRIAENNAQKLAPIEEALDIVPGGLVTLLEEANNAGSMHMHSARMDAHELFKEQGIYYWVQEPGRTPFLGIIEQSAPIPESEASVHIVSLLLEEQINKFSEYNGMTMHEPGIVLDPMVMRHKHNLTRHVSTTVNINDPYVKGESYTLARKVFERTALIQGCAAASSELQQFEENLLVECMRDLGATTIDGVKNIYENDSAIHEVQHHRDISTHMLFNQTINAGDLEYGAYLVNLACSPVRKYLLATHVRRHYQGEEALTQGAYTRITDAYLETLDMNGPLDLLALDDERISAVAEELLDEHYGEDGFCRCEKYF